ncbi:hypothetical protein EMWEY_00056970 [Eimeria maxima]|uniref:Uncharacterized protein n=1 Tax=Eimeria maxima TaxID=5804 RepID=U6M5N9_EIMMA|nr:hypothetical protein EMWEY_00056970 [Eimeria maxima]CDJ59346.1 hypothetical protein EMWEY_00056970 [Eimeria maxima]
MGTQTKEEEGKTAQTNEAKEEEMANRDIAGIAVACWACTGTHGCVDILRVHDVKKTSLALAVMDQFIVGQNQQKGNFTVDLNTFFPLSSLERGRP